MPDLTRVKDILIPDVWNRYFIETTAELSEIIKSGIMAPLAGLSVPDGGVTVNMPFWADLNGDDEVWSSGHEISPDKIDAKKEVAAILTRIKSFGTEDLSGLLAGDDPMAAIGKLFAEYWNRRDQKTLLAIMKGIFGAALIDNELDASTEVITNALVVDALHVLGDASEKIKGILMHSAVRADLAKKKLLDPKPTEAGTNTAPEFDSYMGRRIIVDDGAPKNGNVYTTYLFGTGSIAYAAGTPKVPIEIEREGKKSQDTLIHRRQFIMHPRGMKWKGTAAKDTPSNDELATAANWERAFENKNIPIIQFKHLIR
jgi:hypothetical protein